MTSDNDKRELVRNVGRAIIKKTTVKISGNEVLSIDDSDVFHCYGDLWKSEGERVNDVYQLFDWRSISR